MNPEITLKLERWLSQCQRTTTKYQLVQILQSISKSMEMDYYLMCVVSPQQLRSSELFIVENYPSDWMKYYFEKNLKFNDPVVLYTENAITPLFWQNANIVATTNPKADPSIMHRAEDAGLIDGITIPIRGMFGEFGLISLASKHLIDYDKLIQMNQILLTLSPYLYEASTRIKLNQTSSVQKIELTEREKECMEWISEGKTAWETAQILNISERTVNFHVNNVIDKVGASNRQHAVAKILISGVLKPVI
ncbi:helix-turn-helix transcriptional regulator [Pseudoalteromonas sp. T1lg65]|uniref:helix-turn-helix transcriptional regulator n=1 Tax=Pseudoalteromonas sp. T1lg65 TaxID=2077101 RepID=UPI003F78CCC6